MTTSVIATAYSVDPMARITGVGARVSVAVSVVLALILHAGLATAGVGVLALKDYFDWQSMMQRRLHDRLMSEYEIEVVREPDPPKQAEPEPPTPKPDPEVLKDQPKDQPKEAPAPAAAQAGQVLAADPKSNEPVDLTNSFVQGAGTSYAGGTTAPTGTALTPVRAPTAVGGGTPGGTGTGSATPTTVDRSDRKSVV